jgi:hypothetical protein
MENVGLSRSAKSTDCRFVRYVGEFQHGLFHGRGELTCTRGGKIRMYKGSFKSGVSSGLGVEFLDDAFTRGGCYVDGKLQDQDTRIAQRGYDKKTVRALREIHLPEDKPTFWDQDLRRTVNPTFWEQNLRRASRSSTASTSCKPLSSPTSCAAL